jgi:hypothetical protein
MVTVAQLVKNFFEFYGTRRFVTVLTTARHFLLSWATLIQSSKFCAYFSKMYFNNILPYTPTRSKWSHSFTFPNRILYTLLVFPFREEYKSQTSSLCSFLKAQICSSTPSSQSPSANVLPLIWVIKLRTHMFGSIKGGKLSAIWKTINFPRITPLPRRGRFP